MTEASSDAASRDPLGRKVHLVFVPDFPSIRDVAYPEGTFVLLLAGSTRDLAVDLLYATAELLLERGAVYVVCWGEGASRCEDIFDEAAAMKALDRPDAPVLMTTAHEDETLRDVLEFATTVAVPDERYAADCRDVVLVFHGNVDGYNEAHNLLEQMLRDGED